MNIWLIIYIVLAICTIPIWTFGAKVAYKKHNKKADLFAVALVLICSALFPLTLLAGTIMLAIDEK